MKIIAVHLLNDFSGTRVLSQLVRGWVRNGLCVTVACSKGPGLLSSIAGVPAMLISLSMAQQPRHAAHQFANQPVAPV